MSKRKINWIIIVILVLSSIFMSLSISYINNSFSKQDLISNQSVKEKNQEYNDSIKDLITQESQNNTNIVDKQISFDTFFDIYNNANEYHMNSEYMKTTINGGVIEADVSVNGTPLGNLSMFHLSNTMDITQSRDKNGNKSLYFGMYGDVPNLVNGMFDNQFYALLYYSAPMHYEVLTKDKNDTVNPSGKMNSLSHNSFMDKYKNDIDEVFYNINEDTVKSVEFYSPAFKSTDNAIAKIILNTDQEKQSDSSIVTGTEDYSSEINNLCNFLKPAIFKSCTITFTFTSDGHFVSMQVQEEFTVWYQFISKLGNYTCPIQIESNYTAKFNYKKINDINYIV